MTTELNEATLASKSNATTTDGYGDGYGDGSGYSDGYSDGYGDGYGYSDGDSYSDGYGDGSGDGYEDIAELSSGAVTFRSDMMAAATNHIAEQMSALRIC